MSAEKRAQLIEAGKLTPDGERVEVCPTCLRPLPPGEHLPGATVAEAGTVASGVETQSIGAADVAVVSDVLGTEG